MSDIVGANWVPLSHCRGLSELKKMHLQTDMQITNPTKKNPYGKILTKTSLSSPQNVQSDIRAEREKQSLLRQNSHPPGLRWEERQPLHSHTHCDIKLLHLTVTDFPLKLGGTGL